ncbi:MAG: serine/threonine-protein phosphatase [Clostridiales bacterium]|jgi:serine/threonine protein phosphatase PrpC|nr:serine/threonine-protein phosphatase [Clostridiales bacterium]
MLCCGRTDIGKKRTVNQDSFMCDSFSNGMQLAVVCDGMGGAAGGGIASSIACGVFLESIGDFAQSFGTREVLTHTDERLIKNAMTEAIDAANAAVFDRSGSQDDLRGMGTTLVATLAYCNMLFTINVGDSRMYLITNGVPEQITHDHSYVQYLVDMGKMTQQEARKSVNRNIITRAVGTDNTVEADIYVTRIPAKNITDKIENSDEMADQYVALLCSDGLTNHVTPEEIANAMQDIGSIETSRALGKVAEKLIDMANAAGGADNITAVLMTL